MSNIILQWMRRALVGAVVSAMALSAIAQDAENAHRHNAEAIKERILAKVLEVKHEKLRGELLMDDEQSKRFFAQYDPAEKDLVNLVKQKQSEEVKLLELSQGDHNDADVDKAIDNIKGLNQKIIDRYEQLDKSLKTVLNPRQRARLFAFEKRFNQQVKEKVREKIIQWKEKHPGFRPHGKPGTPGVKPKKQ